MTALPDRLQNELISTIPALRAFARSLTYRTADADDLVQETLARALANIHQFTPGTSLRAWLFTILRNCHYTRAKRQQREQLEADPHELRPVWAEPGQEWSVSIRRLGAALDKLPAPHREVLLLTSAAGLNYDEAAAVCGCAVGTIKSRVSRARARLLALLHAEDSAEVMGEGDGIPASPVK